MDSQIPSTATQSDKVSLSNSVKVFDHIIALLQAEFEGVQHEQSQGELGTRSEGTDWRRGRVLDLELPMGACEGLELSLS